MLEGTFTGGFASSSSSSVVADAAAGVVLTVVVVVAAAAAEAEADNIGKYMDIQVTDNLGLDIWYDDWNAPDNVGNIVYDIIRLDGDTNYNYVNTYTNKLNSLTFDSNYTYQLIYSYV